MGFPLGLELSLAPGLSVKNALLYTVTTIIAVQAVVMRNRKLELLSVIVPWALLVAYAVFTWLVIVLALDYPGYAKFGSFLLLKSNFGDLLLVLIVFFYGVLTTNDALRLARTLVWIVVLTNIVAVVDALNVPDLGVTYERRDGRLGGFVGDSNDYGLFVAFFLPASIALYRTASPKLRLLALAGLVATVMGLVLSASRGAYVAVLLSGILGAFYLRSYIPTRLLVRTLIGVVVVGVAATAALLTTEYSYLLEDRLYESRATDVDRLSSGRIGVWANALARMSEHPTTFITGFGWEAYESENFRYVTHNRYVNLLYNLGLIGVFLFLLFAANAIKFVRGAIDAANEEVKPFLIAYVFGFIALLITMLFSDVYTPWLFIWAFSGVAMRLAANSMSSKQRAPRAEPTQAAAKRLASA
jgi:O-antigen ligase